MGPEKYADLLEKSLGTYDAVRVAEKCFENTRKDTWSNLPIGPIFSNKLDNGWKLQERPLLKNLKFWENVRGIMYRKAKEKGVKV